MKGKHKARIGDYPVFLKLRGKSSHYFRRERASDDDAGPARRCSLNYFCISSFFVVLFISPFPGEHNKQPRLANGNGAK